MSDPRVHRLEMRADSTFERVDLETRTIVALDLPVVKARALSRAAAWRYDRETGGASLPDGTAIATDRATQDALNRILSSLDKGLVSEPIQFKGASGWVTLSAAQITAIAGAVAQHVQAAFEAERALGQQIEAATDAAAIRALLTQAGA